MQNYRQSYNPQAGQQRSPHATARRGPAAPSMETPLRARATPTPHPQTSVAGHKRKISYADLAATYRAAGPMVAPGPPHASMHQQPSLTQAQMHQAHLDELRRRELAKRQSRKPTDRDIPHDVAEAVVGDGVARYGKLRDAEKKLDALMMRKRLDVKDNAQREYARREGVLRVWISNTVEGQPWQVIADEENEAPFELGENSQATFRVKIEGRLIDDEAGEDDEKDKPSTEKRPRLSSFFKAITIDFDRNPALMPDGHSQIEWRKQPPPGQHGGNPQAYDPNSKENSFDTLEFERKGDENVNVTISLIRDSERERFKLSPGLAELLDSEEEDMLGAVQGVWEYARAMRLQEDEDKRTIVCDDALRNLFNQPTLSFPYLPDLLQRHLRPLPPIQLKYTIRVDKDFHNDPQPTKYDLRVPLPNPTQHYIHSYSSTANKAHISTLRDIVGLDDDLALLVQQVNQTNAKRKFYDNLGKDPANFLKRWTSSQQRDLEVILAEATRGGGSGGLGGLGAGEEMGASEEWRRGGENGLWGSVGAKEGVGLWLARQGK